MDEMRRATPPGAVKPWRTAENARWASALVAAGAPQEELIDLVLGVAELMRRGDCEIRWWYPANLFGPNCERWRAQVAALRASQALAQARQVELAQVADQHRAEAQETAKAPLGIRSLEVHKLAQNVLARMRAPAAEDDDQAAG